MPINKETILSVYDDKLTLMQWLKKVEDALKNDTLKDVELLQNGNNVAFKFVFEDSEIITDYLELQANGIAAINYDSTTLQIVVTFTDGTTRVLGPLFDTQSNITVQDLNAVSVTTEKVYADSISVDGDLTSNGSIDASDKVQSDDITARNTISSMERIIDTNGNFRFIEGNLTFEETLIEMSYGKWSLSGTHLMLVIAGTFKANVTVPSLAIIAQASLPAYIAQKIKPVVYQNVDYKTIGTYAEGTSPQSIYTTITINGNALNLRLTTAFTPTQDRTVRIQFDLLIDAE